MMGYKITPLGDWYRTVYYNGKRWTRVESCGWWKPYGTGWTTVQHDQTRFDGVIWVNGL